MILLLKNIRIALVLYTFVVLNLLTVNYAQTPQLGPEISKTHTAVDAAKLKWVSVKWIGNNLPYHIARAEIENGFAQKKITTAKLDTYGAEYLTYKQPTLSLFKWMYATYLGSKQDPPIYPISGPGSARFNEVTDPHCYDYTRMRFLEEADGKDVEFSTLARRLIKKDPKDFQVIYRFVDFYSPTRKFLSKAEALTMAQNLLKLYPDKTQIYTSIGGVYYSDWLQYKRPSDAAKSIYYYKKFLQLAPTSDSFRSYAQQLVREMQQPKG